MRTPSSSPFFVRSLLLPNLKTLSLVTQGEEWDEDDWADFHEFILHFSSNLQSLNLYNTRLNFQKITTILLELTGLVHVALTNPTGIDNWDDLFLFFVLGFSPHIREMTFDRPPSFQEETHTWAYREFVDMLESRRERDIPAVDADHNELDFLCSQLLSVHLHSNDVARMRIESPADHARLMRLVEQGLKLTTSPASMGDEEYIDGEEIVEYVDGGEEYQDEDD